MDISREASIKRVMKDLSMPREVAEDFVDEIDDYMAHWMEQLIAALDKHNPPPDKDMPRWLIEQKERQEKE